MAQSNRQENRIVLIVPCYNERKRLDLGSFIAHSNDKLKILFVDDGSNDGTYEFIQTEIHDSEYCQVIAVPKNCGKGEAIRFAILELQKTQWWENFDWCGFWDADLATPLSEVQHFITFAELYEDVDAIWGSRVYRLGSHIVRSGLRHYLGRAFATVIHQLLRVEAYDTQCGAKLFRKDVILTAFSEVFISRWIFDVEILLRLKTSTVIEYPLRNWQDVPGSKLKVSREVFRVFRDILRIRRKYLKSF